MRSAFTSLLLLTSAPALGQEALDMPALVDGLNQSLQAGTPSAQTSPLYDMKQAPEWGVAIKNNQGQTVDLFGQVPYEITNTGTVVVPGFDAPPGTSLELVPQNEWAATAMALGSAENVDPSFAPITSIPGPVGNATDYLANALCSMKGRPTEITLSLVIGASGGIFFAEASTEAGSAVMWNFPEDICPRYGISSTSSPGPSSASRP